MTLRQRRPTRTGLRLLEKEEREYEGKLTALRAAIAEGDASEDAEGDVFEDLFAYADELAAGKEQHRGKDRRPEAL